MLYIENIMSLRYTYVNQQFEDLNADQNNEWLPLDLAADHFGYAHKESLRRRLRQLRERGLVCDIGRPPAAYEKSEQIEEAPITIMWPNPKTALLNCDAPPELLEAKRGRPVGNKK